MQISLSQFKSVYSDSIKNPEKFWTEIAEKEIIWFKKWNKIFEWKYPYFQWFIGAKLNITYNCLDRHILSGKGNKIALIYTNENYEEEKITYNELLTKVNKFSNALKSLNIKNGDRVLIYMHSSIEQVVCMLGCARIGVIHSVVFAGFSSQSVRDRAVDLKAKVIVASSFTKRRGIKKDLKSIALEAVRDLPDLKHIIILNRDNHSSDKDSLDYNELVSNQSKKCDPLWMDAEDPLFVLYTSGSTGSPKGIVHTVGGYNVFTHYTTKTVFDLNNESILWCTADLGWITGHSYVVYGPLSNGITSLITEGVPDYPSIDHWHKIIAKYGVNIFYTSPTAIRMLKKYGEDVCQKNDLCSLKIIGSVGEPIGSENWYWYYKNIGKKKCVLVDTWWQTETGGHMLATLPYLEQKPGLAGHPFLAIDAKIVNKLGKEVPVGKKGFLVIKKPWPGAMRNCWNDKKRFEKYWNEIKGVFTTGDYAIKDKDGYFKIIGRSDDLINVSGHRIGTAEVENALVGYLDVTEAAVISKPDEIKGERIKAFIVLKSKPKNNKNFIIDLKAHVKKQINSIAVPDEIEIVESLPKTRSGKIMRRVLKARETGQFVGDISTMEE